MDLDYRLFYLAILLFFLSSILQRLLSFVNSFRSKIVTSSVKGVGINVQNQMKYNDEDREFNKELTCIHEAGHALMALVHGIDSLLYMRQNLLEIHHSEYKET